LGALPACGEAANLVIHSTTRITRDDFVTPPEFSSLQLAHQPAGQIGGARIELVVAGGLTRLAGCYQQVPLRVLPPFHFAGERCALLYLLNPTAGLLDGDGHLMEITANHGTRALVTGQSANRVHPAVNGFSTQQWQVHVQSGAQLVVLPGPTIPYRGSRYYQRVVIDLEAGAHLIWGDIWLPGRYARGQLSEWHCFDQIVQEMEVWREGELIYRERFHWHGPWVKDQIAWFCGDNRATGSLFVTGNIDESAVSAARNCDEAILHLPDGDSVVRCCAAPETVTCRLVETALMLASRRIADEAGRWLSSNNLAPNHWFQTTEH
jgi:urease accessory protein